MRNCRQNQKLRNFHSEDFGNESQPDTLDLDDEENKSQTSKPSSLAAITKQHETTSSKVKTFADCVNNWADYINGNSKRPNESLKTINMKHSVDNESFCGKTLISKHHIEKARNKPVVNCRIRGTKCAVLFDTGAEVNVIDEKFLNSLQKNNSNIKFIPSKKF